MDSDEPDSAMPGISHKRKARWPSHPPGTVIDVVAIDDEMD